MAGIVERAREWWRGDGTPQPIAGLMRPIDADAIAAELTLEARGNEAGARESPPSDAISLDSVEQEVVGRLLAEWTLQRGHLIAMLKAYRDRLAELNAAKVIGTLRLSATEAITRFKSSRQELRGDLARLRNAYVEARNELSAFRTKHGLVRPARDPDGKLTTVGLLAFFIAVESVLNGFFFAKGSEAGLIGGIGVAIGISVVNVLVCFGLGYFPARYINWRGWFLRSIALLVTLGGLAGIIFLHFFAAHFRDAMATLGEKQAYSSAGSRLWQDPFGFSDLNSWYLFGLGVLAGLLGFWKGYRLDDPYPHYGDTYRREKAAHDRLADQRDEFFDELKEIRDEVIEKFQAGLANIPEYVAKSEQVKAARTALIEEFRAYERNVEHAGNRLLTIYREACRLRRSTAAPAYFGRQWNLPSSALDGSEIALLTAEVPDTIVEDVKGDLEELRIRSEEVLRAYDELVEAAEHPSDMK